MDKRRVLDSTLLLMPIAKHKAMSGMGSKSLTRRIKVVKQVLKYAGDLRMHVQQMGDGGTPLGGVGNPSDTHILNNPPPSR